MEQIKDFKSVTLADDFMFGEVKGLALYDKKSYFNGDNNCPYNDNSYVVVLNSKYTESNVSEPIEEYLEFVNGLSGSDFKSDLANTIENRMQTIKKNNKLEVEYMVSEFKIRERINDAVKAERAAVLKNLGITEAEYKRIIQEKQKSQ